MTFPPDGSAEHHSASPDALEHRKLVVRRAPKVQVFLLGGALLGVVAAFIVSLVGEGNPEFTFGSTFGYFLVIFGIVGVAVGGLVWLALDRRSRKNTYTVTAEAVADYEDADYAVQDYDLQQWTDKWENDGRDQK